MNAPTSYFIPSWVKEVWNKITIKQNWLKFSKSEIEKIFNSEIFSPTDLINLLRKQFPWVYESDAWVSEKMTLEEHTLLVMRQFERYFSHKPLPWGIYKNLFRLMLALHDIWKAEAIKNWWKDNQHFYTKKFVEDFFRDLWIDGRNTNIVLSLLQEDIIWKYLQWNNDLETTKVLIKHWAKKSWLDEKVFFRLLCIYFKVDAWSYTKDATWKDSYLDKIFIFDQKQKNIGFSSDVQKKIDYLGF
jgi:hypothetical protein